MKNKKNKKPSKFKSKLSLAKSLAIKFNCESFEVEGKKYRIDGTIFRRSI